jgi:hypothetical protein
MKKLLVIFALFITCSIYSQSIAVVNRLETKKWIKSTETYVSISNEKIHEVFMFHNSMVTHLKDNFCYLYKIVRTWETDDSTLMHMDLIDENFEDHYLIFNFDNSTIHLMTRNSDYYFVYQINSLTFKD